MQVNDLTSDMCMQQFYIKSQDLGTADELTHNFGLIRLILNSKFWISNFILTV